MIMQHQQAAQLVQESLSKWQLFLARQLLNVGVAFTLPFITIGLMHLLISLVRKACYRFISFNL